MKAFFWLVAALAMALSLGCASEDTAMSEKAPRAEPAKEQTPVEQEPEPEPKETPAAQVEVKSDATLTDFVGEWRMVDAMRRSEGAEEPRYVGTLRIAQDGSYTFDPLGRPESGTVETDGPALKLVPKDDEGGQSGSTYELKLTADGERLVSDMEGPRSLLEFHRAQPE